jgi:murein L,D-transpeptidase YafK
MTPLNMARHRNSPHTAFWRMLKQGYDHFEVNGEQEGQHARSAGFTPQKTANTEPEAKRDSPIFCVNYMAQKMTFKLASVEILLFAAGFVVDDKAQGDRMCTSNLELAQFLEHRKLGGRDFCRSTVL